mgnify:CR=1 FL=1
MGDLFFNLILSSCFVVTYKYMYYKGHITPMYVEKFKLKGGVSSSTKKRGGETNVLAVVRWSNASVFVNKINLKMNGIN